MISRELAQNSGTESAKLGYNLQVGGFPSQLRATSEYGIVQLLTHKRDCGAIFDRVPVHWSMLAEITLFACTAMDSMDKIWVKLDRIWILRTLADLKYGMLKKDTTNEESARE